MTAEGGAICASEMQRWKRPMTYSEIQRTRLTPDVSLMRSKDLYQPLLPATDCSFWAVSLSICIIICRVHNKWRLPGLTGLILVLPAVFLLVGLQGKIILSLYLACLPCTREPLSACVQRSSTSQTSLYISCDGYLQVDLCMFLFNPLPESLEFTFINTQPCSPLLHDAKPGLPSSVSSSPERCLKP